MTDDATTPAAGAATPIDEIATNTPVARRCPWCSELLPDEATDRCPACRANLVPGAETHLPGLTEVEPATAARVRRADAPKRSKLLSWISGDIDDAALLPVGAGDVEALAPPPRDVRREILRLKLEAEGLTVAADGSIEVPVAAADVVTADAPHGTDVPADQTAPAAAVAGEAAEPPTYDTDIHGEDIRKAS